MELDRFIAEIQVAQQLRDFLYALYRDIMHTYVEIEMEREKKAIGPRSRSSCCCFLFVFVFFKWCDSPPRSLYVVCLRQDFEDMRENRRPIRKDGKKVELDLIPKEYREKKYWRVVVYILKRVHRRRGSPSSQIHYLTHRRKKKNLVKYSNFLLLHSYV